MKTECLTLTSLYHPYSNQRVVSAKGIERFSVLRCILYLCILRFFFQLHALPRTQQSRQREPSVKTLRSPLSAEFWRHCVLSGRIQRRACPGHQSEDNGNINLSKYFISSSGDRIRNQSVSHFVPLRHDWPQSS